MKELSAVLTAATDEEDPIIRDAARRAGVLWACRCGDDHAQDQLYVVRIHDVARGVTRC